MKAYLVQDYFNALEQLASFSLAEAWDNVGLLIGSGCQPVNRALMALDATLPVIREAEQAKADLIITHHPIIFHKLGRIPAESPAYQAIQKGIAVICAHTNLDIAEGGVNDALADRLNLTELSFLEEASSTPWYKMIVYVPLSHAETVYNAMTRAGAGRQGNYGGAAFLSPGEGRFMPLEGANPFLGAAGALEHAQEQRLEMLISPDCVGRVVAAMKQAHPYEEPAYDLLKNHAFHTREGVGRVGTLETPLSPAELAAYVQHRLGVGGIKYVPGAKEIRKVALCGGSGGSLIGRAVAAGAQALVTGDVKHDQLLEALHMGLTLIDAGHYATEAVVLPPLLERLHHALPGSDISLADACRDPARHLANP